MPYNFEKLVRNIPDFPIPGILFRDFGPVFADNKAIPEIKEALLKELNKRNIKPTKVLGLESRGYILGTIIAEALNCGFVMLRKPGKLPGETYSVPFDLEYKQGETIEMQKGIISPNDIVLIHDDLLATGGTAKAAIDLALKAGVPKENIKLCFISEITGLGAPERL